MSASVLSRRFLSTTSPLNTATLRSLALMPWTYSPRSLFSTLVSLPSNMMGSTVGWGYRSLTAWTFSRSSQRRGLGDATRCERACARVRACIAGRGVGLEATRADLGASEVSRVSPARRTRLPEPPSENSTNNVGVLSSRPSKI